MGTDLLTYPPALPVVLCAATGRVTGGCASLPDRAAAATRLSLVCVLWLALPLGAAGPASRLRRCRLRYRLGRAGLAAAGFGTGLGIGRRLGSEPWPQAAGGAAAAAAASLAAAGVWGAAADASAAVAGRGRQPSEPAGSRWLAAGFLGRPWPGGLLRRAAWPEPRRPVSCGRRPARLPRPRLLRCRRLPAGASAWRRLGASPDRSQAFRQQVRQATASSAPCCPGPHRRGPCPRPWLRSGPWRPRAAPRGGPPPWLRPCSSAGRSP